MSITNLLEFKHRKGCDALADAGRDFRLQQAYNRMKQSQVMGPLLDKPYEQFTAEDKQHFARRLAVSHAFRQSERGEL